MNRFYKYILLLTILVFGSCSEDFDKDVKDYQLNSGEADFSNYVALGNSLTAGFSDGALYKSLQEQSYPAILSGLMGIPKDDFKQPYMPDDVGGFSDLFQKSAMSSYYGKLSLEIIEGAPSPTPSIPQNTLSQTLVNGTYNNLGVPGAKSYHLLAQAYGNANYLSIGKANPYFVRMATSPQVSVLEDALAVNPSFFTLWIGNNDVLSYALSGGTGVNQKNNRDASTYASTDLSSPELVAEVIDYILQQLTLNGAKGAVANIPDVTSIPYFTTVPTKAFVSTNEAYTSQVESLNNSFELLNMVFKALGAEDRMIAFSSTEDSAPIIVDDSLEDISEQMKQMLMANGLDVAQASLLADTYGQVRQATAGDYFVLTLSSKLGKVNKDRVKSLMQWGLSEEEATKYSVQGLTLPLADKDVLSSQEIKEIKEATAAINSSISNLASKYNLALVDLNSKMKSLQQGIKYNAVDYSANFISGGAFSLDGIHLNGRGYAIIANYFAAAINYKYKATLAAVNPNDYSGTVME